MSLLNSAFRILWDCIDKAASAQAKFSSVILLGIVVAALSHLACFYSVRLWNRKFQMSLQHHAVCGITGLATLFFVISFYSLSYVEIVVRRVVISWRENLERDRAFNEKMGWDIYRTFEAKWPEEQKSPRNVPPQTVVPDGLYREASIMTSGVITRLALSDFNNRFSILSKILGASRVKAQERARSKIQPELTTTLSAGGRYPYSDALNHVAEAIQHDLGPKLPRVVQSSRIALLLAFLLVQVIAFGLVALLGYGDIHVRA